MSTERGGTPSGEAGPQRRYSSAKRDRRRALIVAAATREMNQHGVQGLVLAEIAAQVGMTKANLTYYFRRKEDLAALCIDQTLAEYQDMIAAAALEPTARERLRALFDIFFTRIARTARGEAPPLAGLGVLPGLEEPYASQAIAHYRALLQATGALLQAPGGPVIDRAGRITRAQLVLTQLFWFSVWAEHCDPGDYPRLAQRLFQVVADGFAPAGTPVRIAAPAPPPEVEADPQRAGFYQATTRLINLLGYRGASVDRIGAAMNVTKGSVYHHHASKEDVVLACAERSFAIMWATIRAAEALAGDPWARLSATVSALMAFQASERGPFLRASALSALPAGSRETVGQRWGQVTNHLAGLIADGMGEGALRPADPIVAAQVIAAAINAAEEIHRFAPAGQVDIAAFCVVPTLHGVLADDPAVAARRGARAESARLP